MGNVNQWKISGNQWNSMEINGKSMVNQWKSIEINGKYLFSLPWGNEKWRNQWVTWQEFMSYLLYMMNFRSNLNL
jgi:hypothetical protein